MTKPRANEPCPCGSGRKYKRCCLDSIAREPAQVAGDRLVQIGGDPTIASTMLDAEDLSAVTHYLERKKRGQGPADDMALFIEPLMSFVTEPRMEGTVQVLGSVYWVLALMTDDAERRQAFDETIGAMNTTEAQREALWELAQVMIERHRALFPDLHT